MNNRDPHIVNSLRRWIQGDVNQKEESQLEQDAREDLFLQEALEGYRQFPEGRHQERLERIQQQLQSKPRKRVGLLISFPYRIAAAAAVLLLVGLFWFLNPAQTNELAEAARTEVSAEAVEDETSAQETKISSEASTPTAETTVSTEGESPASAANAFIAQDHHNDEAELNSPEPSVAKSREFIEVKPLDTAAKKLEEPAEPIARKEIVVAKPKADSAVRTEYAAAEPARTTTRSNSVAQPTSSPPASPPPSNNLTEGFPIGGVKLNQSSGSRLVTGQVFDRSGAPLDGVLVVSPGDRTGTITNINGQYQILLDSNVQKLEFQRTGYNFQRIDLPDSGGIVRVTLDETAPTVDKLLAREEASQKRRKVKVNPSVSGINAFGNIAQPIVGYKRFENYLSLNLKYPEQALENGITGEVVLSFTILPDGQFTNVRAISGPGYGLEQEAIRLLQGGAKWKITNGSKESISFTYRMKFNL